MSIQDAKEHIPSWISDDKVSELRLKVVEVSDILDFGSFFSVVTWIKRCIEGLPFPNALRKLNIEVRSNQLNEVSNPTRADYELLRRTLQPLHQHGSLQHTNLRIGTLLFNHHTALFDDIATREVEKLRGVFTPLLEANQLTIDVVFERWGQVEEPKGVDSLDVYYYEPLVEDSSGCSDSISARQSLYMIGASFVLIRP
ncbi:hypothetical protein AB1N83_009130 [Pleurotus pulmonarius]